MNIFYKICVILIIIGGINWGLIGLFSFDAVAWLLGGSASLLSRAVYTVVGIAALCAIPSLFGSEPQACVLGAPFPGLLGREPQARRAE